MGWGGCDYSNVPISTEGSGTPTMRPKTGNKDLGAEGLESNSHCNSERVLKGPMGSCNTTTPSSF